MVREDKTFRVELERIFKLRREAGEYRLKSERFALLAGSELQPFEFVRLPFIAPRSAIVRCDLQQRSHHHRS